MSWEVKNWPPKEKTPGEPAAEKPVVEKLLKFGLGALYVKKFFDQKGGGIKNVLKTGAETVKQRPASWDNAFSRAMVDLEKLIVQFESEDEELAMGIRNQLSKSLLNLTAEKERLAKLKGLSSLQEKAVSSQQEATRSEPIAEITEEESISFKDKIKQTEFLKKEQGKKTARSFIDRLLSELTEEK